MKKANWSIYFWKILWFIGLIILANINFNIMSQAKEYSNSTFNSLPQLWVNSLIPFIFGLYISLIFVKKWKFNITGSLLWCVSIPSIIISFGSPILVTFSLHAILPEKLAISILFWFMDMSTFDVFGIIAGLTLILSFFHTQSNNNINYTSA